MLLVSLIVGGTGCTSIYHRAQSQLPPEPGAELRLRVTEAQQAAKTVNKACARLLDSLEGRKSGSVTGPDFDRLEAAAFELERRVCALRDAVKRCGEQGKEADTIDGFNRLAQSRIEYVRANRLADRTVQLRELQHLVQ